MRQNAEQKNSEYGHFSRSELIALLQTSIQPISAQRRIAVQRKKKICISMKLNIRLKWVKTFKLQSQKKWNRQSKGIKKN